MATFHSFIHSSVCCLAREAIARGFYLALTAAALGPVWRVSSLFFGSSSAVHLQVSFARRLLLFPSGVHCRAFEGREVSDIRQTWSEPSPSPAPCLDFVSPLLLRSTSTSLWFALCLSSPGVSIVDLLREER